MKGILTVAPVSIGPRYGHVFINPLQPRLPSTDDWGVSKTMTTQWREMAKGYQMEEQMKRLELYRRFAGRWVKWGENEEE